MDVADNVNLLTQIFSFAPNFSLLNLKIKIVILLINLERKIYL
ncbi:hypothetical protein ATCC51561_1499 [Campylobacter concisus ATCC 51561]|nr:hypothetical protein ATCC51561_1499 [Campylobacter concisus ATCC 51561]